MLVASWAELAWLALAVIAAGVVTGLLAGVFGIGGGAVIASRPRCAPTAPTKHAGW